VVVDDVVCVWEVHIASIFRVKMCRLLSFFVYIIISLQPFVGPWPTFQFLDPIYTVGMTSWTGDQPVARPLSRHIATQNQNKRTQYGYPCLERDHSVLAS
jgi:hypothetical protein